MRNLALVILASVLAGCATAPPPAPARKVAAEDVTGQLQVNNQTVGFRIIDRGWSSSTALPVQTIEATRSYLFIYEVSSAEVYKKIALRTSVKAEEQCEALKAQEKANPQNYVEGFDSSITSKIVNTLHMPQSFMVRHVCLISVLAARKP